MKYNFDEYHDRSENQAVKYEFLEPMFGSKDLLAMWVADMDFKAADPIIQALQKRLDQGIFGYTAMDDGFYYSFINWVKKRHDWEVNKDWLIFSSGVVPTLIFSVLALTEPGDKIIIQKPVYGPFMSSIEEHGRELVNNPLTIVDGEYRIDFEDLIKSIDDGAKAIMFCNPHNPVGRVWSKDDLAKLAKIVVEKDIILISDEIHSDLILKGHKHVPIASLYEEIAQRTITCMAPTKTFNLAGLQTSIVVVPNEEIFKKLRAWYQKMDMNINNCFGQVAFEAAYNESEEWLEQALEYIESSMDWVVDYMTKNVPQVKVYKPQGTYLMWFDFKALNMSHEELQKFIVEKANLAMTGGDFFGSEGEGFMRYNVATTRERVKQGVYQIERAIRGMK